ncbi:vacuolar protein sorting-associated protein 13A [Pelomyxa schiedti]|nr:vacuolar protein sorting-associated protein 13A [Pelomyxa schiedti]
MLSRVVAEVVSRCVGPYVMGGMTADQIKVGLWSGEAELGPLELNPEAEIPGLNSFVVVKKGSIGRLSVKVPWDNLRTQPVVIVLDNVFLLASPRIVDPAQEAAQQYQKKLSDIQWAWESAIGSNKKTWSESLIGRVGSEILDNIQMSLSHIHMIYEDSSPGSSQACGLTLEQMTVQSVSAETCSSSLFCKEINITNIGLYVRPIFECANDIPPDPPDRMDAHIPKATLKINSGNIHSPSYASFTLNLLVEALTITAQPSNLFVLYNLINRNLAARTIPTAHYIFRPTCPVSTNPQLWWQYAIKSVSSQLQRRWHLGKHFWKHRHHLREEYIKNFFSSDPNDQKQVAEAEKTLSVNEIIYFRLSAMKKRYPGAKNIPQSWLSWMWPLSSTETLPAENPFLEPLTQEQNNALVKFVESSPNHNWDSISKLEEICISVTVGCTQLDLLSSQGEILAELQADSPKLSLSISSLSSEAHLTVRSIHITSSHTTLFSSLNTSDSDAIDIAMRILLPEPRECTLKCNIQSFEITYNELFYQPIVREILMTCEKYMGSSCAPLLVAKTSSDLKLNICISIHRGLFLASLGDHHALLLAFSLVNANWSNTKVKVQCSDLQLKASGVQLSYKDNDLPDIYSIMQPLDCFVRSSEPNRVVCSVSPVVVVLHEEAIKLLQMIPPTIESFTSLIGTPNGGPSGEVHKQEILIGFESLFVTVHIPFSTSEKVVHFSTRDLFLRLISECLLTIKTEFREKLILEQEDSPSERHFYVEATDLQQADLIFQDHKAQIYLTFGEIYGYISHYLVHQLLSQLLPSGNTSNTFPPQIPFEVEILIQVILLKMDVGLTQDTVVHSQLVSVMSHTALSSLEVHSQLIFHEIQLSDTKKTSLSFLPISEGAEAVVANVVISPGGHKISKIIFGLTHGSFDLDLLLSLSNIFQPLITKILQPSKTNLDVEVGFLSLQVELSTQFLLHPVSIFIDSLYLHRLRNVIDQTSILVNSRLTVEEEILRFSLSLNIETSKKIQATVFLDDVFSSVSLFTFMDLAHALLKMSLLLPYQLSSPSTKPFVFTLYIGNIDLHCLVSPKLDKASTLKATSHINSVLFVCSASRFDLEIGQLLAGLENHDKTGKHDIVHLEVVLPPSSCKPIAASVDLESGKLTGIISKFSLSIDVSAASNFSTTKQIEAIANSFRKHDVLQSFCTVETRPRGVQNTEINLGFHNTHICFINGSDVFNLQCSHCFCKHTRSLTVSTASLLVENAAVSTTFKKSMDPQKASKQTVPDIQRDTQTQPHHFLSPVNIAFKLSLQPHPGSAIVIIGPLFIDLSFQEIRAGNSFFQVLHSLISDLGQDKKPQTSQLLSLPNVHLKIPSIVSSLVDDNGTPFFQLRLVPSDILVTERARTLVISDTSLSLKYFNLHCAFWEPFIEPFRFSLKGSHYGTSYQLSIESIGVLNVNITKALIERATQKQSNDNVKFTPMEVINTTGSQIVFNLGHGQTSQLHVTPASRTPIPHWPHLIGSKKYRAFSLDFTVEGYKPSRLFYAPGMPKTVPILLEESPNNRTLPFTLPVYIHCEVLVDKGSRVVTIKSPVTLRNFMSLSVEVHLLKCQKTVSITSLESGREVGIPFEALISEGYVLAIKEASQELITTMVDNLARIPLLSRTLTYRNVLTNFVFCAQFSFSPGKKLNASSAPQCTITLVPPVSIENSLCVALTFKAYTAQGILAVETVLDPGKTQELHCLDDNFFFSICIPGSTFTMPASVNSGMTTLTLTTSSGSFQTAVNIETMYLYYTFLRGK